MKSVLFTFLMLLSVKSWALGNGDVFSFKQLEKAKPLLSTKVPKEADYKGKVVIVDFWASWCGPCKEAFPFYDRLAKKYGKDGLIVVAVSEDDEATAAEGFLKEHPVSFATVLDDGRKLSQELRLEAVPTTFIVGKDGKISRIHSGFKASDDGVLTRTVLGLLKK